MRPLDQFTPRVRKQADGIMGCLSSSVSPPIHTVLQAAGHWFLNSGIQDPGGGVARFYRIDQAENADVSTEITGYTVSALVQLYRDTGEMKYQNAAVCAARFLTRHAWDSELNTFPFEVPAANPRFSYFFDCGIIVRGLLAVWRITKDEEFRKAAIAGGRAMLTDFPPHSPIHPILALPAKQPLAWEAQWSRSPGCYQLKSALAWRELADATGDATFLEGYEHALEAALQNSPEFLPGDPDRERVMDRLHAYSYFLEGLLPVLDRPECLAAFRAGIDRAAGFLRDIAPQFARSDVYAQVLRVRLLGAAQGALPLNESAAAHEAEQAASFQIEADDPRIAGGFFFGRKRGQNLAYANPVSTAFCVQALAMWDQHREAKLNPDWRALT